MSQDIIVHFQPEIPQIIVGQENSDGQLGILNIIKGQDSIKVFDYLTGRRHDVKRRGTETTTNRK